MRTTIRLDEDLLKEAKRQAAESRTTLTGLIEEALRLRLYRSRTPEEPRKPVRLNTYGSGGVLPGVDLDDSAALLDVMDNAI